MTDGPADAAAGSPPAKRSAFRTGLAIAALVVVLFAAVVSAISVWTSPPSVRSIPQGHLVFLEADEPSEHTSMLRGMYVAGTDGRPALVLHETEPQDVDAGSREWFNEPAFSPDGRHIAFVKQLITLQEEQQSIVNQIWELDIDPATEKPGHARMLANLTRLGLSPPIGIAWRPDGRGVVGFSEDGKQGGVFKEWIASTAASPTLTLTGRAQQLPIRFPGYWAREFTLALRGPASRAALIALPDDATRGDSGPDRQQPMKPVPGVACYAVDSTGTRLAYCLAHANDRIMVVDVASGARALRAPYGWSLLGHRRITALRWSPDGRFLVYSVSKPPVAEDELFLLDATSGVVRKLPYRTGQAAWDWGK